MHIAMIYKKMKVLLGVFMALVFAELCYASVLYGDIYGPDLRKFEGMVQIEVNSSPRQYRVATDGTYSFFLPVGEFLITARYVENGVVMLEANQKVVVRDEGRFIHDLVLLPTNETYVPPPPNNNDDDNDEPLNDREMGYVALIIIGSVLLVLILGFFIMRSKHKELKEDEGKEALGQSEKIAGEEIPEEKRDNEDESKAMETLEGVIQIIKENGGRTTQKDIRKKIPLSEAKISLMIAELEDKGIVRKIKKGRANIIILNQEKDKIAKDKNTRADNEEATDNSRD